MWAQEKLNKESKCSAELGSGSAQAQKIGLVPHLIEFVTNFVTPEKKYISKQRPPPRLDP